MIASGPQIQSGQLTQEVFIQDITPTLLYLMGVPIPECYDGRVISELFSDVYRTEHPEQYYNAASQGTKDPAGSDLDAQNEFEESKKMLQNLGYL